MNKVIAFAHEFKARYLWLGVWENNHTGIRFYKSYGFKKFGEHPSIVPGDLPPDWLMKKEL